MENALFAAQFKRALKDGVSPLALRVGMVAYKAPPTMTTGALLKEMGVG